MCLTFDIKKKNIENRKVLSITESLSIIISSINIYSPDCFPMTAHIRRLVAGRFVGLVGWLVCRVIIFYKTVKLHFHAPIGALAYVNLF